MTQYSLPHYLGYGVINRDTYRKEGEKEFVDYVYKNQTILTAEVSPTGAMIEEYFNGKRLSISFGKDLKRAVFQHYLASDQLKSQLHLDWINEVVGIGNIYAEMIQKTELTVLFFPAVYLIDIKIPIAHENEAKLQQFLKKPEIIKHRPSTQKAVIKTRYVHKSEDLTVSLLTIKTPIAFTIEVLNLIKEAGLISPEKRLRGIVSQARTSYGPMMRNFIGAPTDDWKSYSLIFENTL